MKQFIFYSMTCLLVLLAGCGAGALFDYFFGYAIPIWF